MAPKGRYIHPDSVQFVNDKKSGGYRMAPATDKSIKAGRKEQMKAFVSGKR